MSKSKLYDIVYRTTLEQLPIVMQALQDKSVEFVGVRECPDAATPAKRTRHTSSEGAVGLIHGFISRNAGATLKEITDYLTHDGYAPATAKARISELLRTGVIEERAGGHYFLTLAKSLVGLGKIGAI